MPRTNVVGTTAAPGSGAQRSAQAGEREHRTDSTAGTATAKAAAKTRHHCRNPRCRSKLPAPVESVRKAFCCRGCHSAFTAPVALSVRRTPEPIRSPARSGSGLASASSAAGNVRPKPANFPTFMRACYWTPSGARVAQVHAIKWASKPAPRATDQLAIVCAVGCGGAETAFATTCSTTETA
jgi:hypothetical protein